jgi:tRNA G46 methylase TrmB
LRLAQRHADALVIGVDKSAHRLQTGARALGVAGSPRNALLLRCDVVDFWLLAAAAGWRFAAQYLLYPNPWPKPEHVQRRWPGHPVLPALLACGGTLELRTNWKIYADEWCLALDLANIAWHMDCLNEPEPLSPFESKYHASAHTLWRVQTDSAACAALA